MIKKTQTQKVTERSTKSEILDAYQVLLKELEGDEFDTEVANEEKKIVETAKHETIKKILDDLSDLKLESSHSISALTDKLTQEAERLSTLQKAIEISQKELEELYQIKVRARMLKTMIELQKQKEVELEQEIRKKRAEWEEEQKTYEEQLKRGRTRGEEEYTYQLNMKKQHDLDEWSEEKKKHERVRSEEKEERLQVEDELSELRKKVTAFPAELDKAIKDAVAKTISDQRKEAQIAQSFAKQESQAAERIAALKIASLDATVKAQATEVGELKRQLESATKQVKDIAVSVIEGSKKDSSPVQSRPPQANS